MSISSLWEWLEGLALAQEIGISWWFPFLESIHVLSIAFVVGSILTVDLRLLGLSALDYAASRVVRELVPWTWGAFLLALPTGFGMFMTRASHYAGNPAFRIKMILLVLAGANMAFFQLRSIKNIESWDRSRSTPRAARIAGAISLLLWAGVVLAGRWTGHLN